LPDPREAGPQLARLCADTILGIGVSNIIAVCITDATAATLHATGVTDIHRSSQATDALRPIAGEFTFAVFAAASWGRGCSRRR